MATDRGDQVFKDIKGDDVAEEVIVIESLCLNCHEQGETRLLLTRIPLYKEVVVMSFHCEHCGWSNNELQSASTIQEMGQKLSLDVRYARDLNRQVVKTEYASLCIPELEFEVAEKTQPGLVTTIEGLIDRSIQGIRQMLSESSALESSSREKLEEFVLKLENLKTLEKPFRFVIEDCSGNSFVENPYHPEKDLQMVSSHFRRTPEQNSMLGLSTPTVEATEAENLKEEVHSFPTFCPECGVKADTKMKLTVIPHFKEVVIMATTCDGCGHKTTEVKSGGGIEEKGKRIELSFETKIDLARDVLKSETCSLEIPELEFEVGAGLIAGKFTTIEGLFEDLISQLGRDNPFLQGDSASSEQKGKLEQFIQRLDNLKECKDKCTIILDDPCGNSYIQNLNAPEDDPQLKITQYERTFEQNEELGLNDMKVENYTNE